MDNLLIPATDFTPKVSFMAETGHFELTGVSRPEDVGGFYEEPLAWLVRFEELVLKSEYKYEVKELKFSINLSYFNSSSSKYISQLFRHLRNLSDHGLDIRIDWYYEEGDEKMLEDGEDLAEALELDFNFIELED